MNFLNLIVTCTIRAIITLINANKETIIEAEDQFCSYYQETPQLIDFKYACLTLIRMIEILIISRTLKKFM